MTITVSNFEFTKDNTNLQERSRNDPTTLYPTCQCFDDSMDYLEHLLRNKGLEEARRAFLVHGMMTIAGTEILHGWVEYDGQVMDGKFLNGELVYIGISIEDFYKNFKVVDRVKYSLAEVVEMNSIHETYGPWEPRYLNILERRETLGLSSP